MTDEESSRSPQTFEGFVADAQDRARERLGDIGRSNAVPVGMILRRLHKLMAVEVELEGIIPEGLTWASFRVCFALWVRGPLEPGRVALLSSMSRAAVSSARKTLTERGYVTTVDSPTDQRSIVMSLTPEGVASTEETYRRHLALTQEWLSPLSDPEQQILLGLLGKLMSSPSALRFGPGKAINSSLLSIGES
ncbi:MarR family winged helix-turn-helix transcriptional regulator [Leucobacter massiliensis]|uniref:HTH marR-type domain-containing protein n=1 Tax=Leucobacter massiliensis TaxID=1686285 RepID=A0A2S9QMH4_9MICO|nr:MarR family transcriptional regulator [Leucobacter massiliensis]PRI10773.1 hypothetical protein B4915_07690 [Leucobacter massiliensis]